MLASVYMLFMFLIGVLSGIVAPIVLLFQGGIKYLFYGVIFTCIGNYILFLPMLILIVPFLMFRENVNGGKAILLDILCSLILHILLIIYAILIFKYTIHQNLYKYTFLPLWFSGCFSFILTDNAKKSDSNWLAPLFLVIAMTISAIILVIFDSVSLGTIKTIIIIPMILSWILDVIIAIVDPANGSCLQRVRPMFKKE